MSSQQIATPSGGSALSSPAAIARQAYVFGIYALGLAVVIQFLFAGLGIFFDYQFLALWHAAVGAVVIGVGALLLAGIGWLGRGAGRTPWLAAAVFRAGGGQSGLVFPFHL